MIDLKILSLDDYYIILKNEEIENTNIPNLDYKNNQLTINFNGNLKVFYNLSKDIKLNYLFSEGLNINFQEYFIDINADITINQTFNVLNNTTLNWGLYFENANGYSIKRNAKTFLNQFTYIKLDSLSMSSSPLEVNNDFYLEDHKCELLLANAIINNSGLVQNYHYNVHHNVGNNKSDIINYAISKNNSILNINNDGIIKKNASKTDLHQKTKGVILDSLSQISANPILEIDEYDVIASHGASIGAIDDEDLFYMMSRGLSKSDSEKLIVSGLVYPYIETIDNQKLREYVQKQIEKYL